MLPVSGATGRRISISLGNKSPTIIRHHHDDGGGRPGPSPCRIMTRADAMKISWAASTTTASTVSTSPTKPTNLKVPMVAPSNDSYLQIPLDKLPAGTGRPLDGTHDEPGTSARKSSFCRLWLVWQGGLAWRCQRPGAYVIVTEVDLIKAIGRFRRF